MEEKLEKEATLRELYYSPEIGLRSPDHLYKKVKEKNPNLDITKNFVQNWLLGQASYTRFKKWNHPKYYRHTLVRDFDQLQIDLVVKMRYPEENQGYENILVAIEILSRFAFAFPLKTKTGEEVKKVIEKLLDDFLDRFDKYPKFIQFDEGNEFLNKNVEQLFEEKEITYFFTNSPRKASVVERLNRTLKTMMMRLFEAQNNHNWVDHLSKLIENYNNSFHRSIGMKPKDVDEKDKFTIWGRLFGKLMSIKKPKYKVGDRVRVLKLNIQYRVAQLRSGYHQRTAERNKKESEKTFGDKFREKYKDYDPEKVTSVQHAVAIKRPPFSAEIFDISRVLLGDPVVYKLYGDEFKKEVLGIFYEEELSLVKE